MELSYFFSMHRTVAVFSFDTIVVLSVDSDMWK